VATFISSARWPRTLGGKETVKYKHIHSAIHNFGYSFTSLMNYVDGDYVIDELAKIHAKGYDIEVDWLTGQFNPAKLATPRIQKSIKYWRDTLQKHMSSQNVDLKVISQFKFLWPAGRRKHMVALDDRGKEYKIYVNESK
jgi:hypothetical protein